MCSRRGLAVRDHLPLTTQTRYCFLVADIWDLLWRIEGFSKTGTFSKDLTTMEESGWSLRTGMKLLIMNACVIYLPIKH
mgnify:CR=1 FL=1